MKRAGISLFLLALIVSLSPGVSYGAEGYVYATTNMTWAEFYAGETGETSADLLSAGLDAISTPTTALRDFRYSWVSPATMAQLSPGLKAFR